MIYTISSNRAVGFYPHSPVNVWSGSSLNTIKKPKNETKTKVSTDSIRKLSFQTSNIETIKIDAKVEKPLNIMSRRTKLKIRDKIEIFYASSSKNNFSLVTLSFINRVYDLQAVACLNKFLTVVRKRNPGVNYIWVAERQNENYKYPGNIHFHIVVNSTFNIKEYNQLWVNQQYHSGIQFDNITLSDVRLHRKLGTTQTVLNPFDIKRISDTNGLSAYLTNYVTKNVDEFKCRVWGSSQTISKLYTKQVIGERHFNQLELPFNSRLNKKTGQLYVSKKYTHSVTNALTGEDKVICVIHSVINKKYFHKAFMHDLIEINKQILQGEIIVSPKMHFDAYDAIIDNPENYSEYWIDKHIKQCIERRNNNYYAN